MTRTSIAALATLFAVGVTSSAYGQVPATAAPADPIAAAIAARKAGDFAGAAGLLEGLVARDPKNARARHELGVLYAVHGQLPEAAGHFRGALELDPDLHASRRNLAEVLRADGRCSDALPQYAELYDAEPAARADALRGRAICEEAGGDVEAARLTLTRLANGHSDSPAGRWAAGHLAALDSEGGTDAITAMQCDGEGRKLFEEQRYGDAAAWFGMAFEQSQSADRAYRQGIALLAARDYGGAASAFERALALEPAHLPALGAWRTAQLKRRQDGSGGASVEFVADPNLDPTPRVAKALSEGDLTLAERVASAGLGGRFKGATLHMLRAEARLRGGRLRLAELDLSAVLRGRKTYAPATAAMAELRLRQGRIRDARTLAGLPAADAPVFAASRDQQLEGQNDLVAFTRYRRIAFNRLLAMHADPGLKPLLPFDGRDALDPESIAPPPAPAPGAKPRRASKSARAKSRQNAKGQRARR